MKIERPLNNFCRGGQLLHDAVQRQTERDIKRMRRWAREDAEQNAKIQEELDLEHIRRVFEIMNSIPNSNSNDNTNIIIIDR